MRTKDRHAELSEQINKLGKYYENPDWKTKDKIHSRTYDLYIGVIIPPGTKT